MLRRGLLVGLLIVGFIGALSSPYPASADEMEQGLSYSCDAGQQELNIATLWKDGGGQDDPYKEFDSESSALWDIDRMDRKALPILKTCRIGTHTIFTVIRVGCTAGNGFSPMVSLYTNAKVSLAKNGEVRIEGDVLRKETHRPFAEAEFFGGLCSPDPEVSFSKISVKFFPADGGSLIVSMN